MVTYDAPAHGESPGRITAMPEMAHVLREVAFRLGGLHGVVAHSVGGAATLLAIRNGLKLHRAVLLAPPSDMRGFIDLFGEHIGLPPQSHAAWPVVPHRGSTSIGDTWRSRTGPRETFRPLLVFHDRTDCVVPWDHGARVAQIWGDAELHSTTGLGHSGVRRDPDVIEKAVEFLISGSGRP